MMSQQPPILSIRDAQKSYAKVHALRGVNLDLYAGELLGFLGPNGAGKTTLIRCLAGRSELDAGTLEFGDAIGDREGLGVVPQTIALYQDLTAAQNLFVFGRLHAVPRSQLRARVQYALEWSNLTERRRHLVKTFSGGMQRRLNIACSVLHQPKILLLDEPTVGVDPQSRERIYEMLDELRDAGTAMLLTTHQLDEAQFRCDRIAIVDQGQVVRVGTLDDLVTGTVGQNQRLQVRFRSAPAVRPPALSMDADGRTGSCAMSDVAVELPLVLNRLHAVGQPIDHVVLQQPTLQDVFLHLTGKDLRE
jgi:ABC-2 type transport system ATP-binding protein